MLCWFCPETRLPLKAICDDKQTGRSQLLLNGTPEQKETSVQTTVYELRYWRRPEVVSSENNKMIGCVFVQLGFTGAVRINDVQQDSLRYTRNDCRWFNCFAKEEFPHGIFDIPESKMGSD